MVSNSPDIGDPVPSKSQRKREVRVLFELARDLVAMSNRQLSSLPVETDLRDAIGIAQSIKSHVARKRQVQFIAKMMRKRDVQMIQEALAAQELEARQLTGRHHRTEAWRDCLLSGGDDVLAALLKQREASNVQALRHLIRNARKEASLQKPPASARKLFILLRDMDSEQALPAIPGTA
jgi:ribosome-associated protein